MSDWTSAFTVLATKRALSASPNDVLQHAQNVLRSGGQTPETKGVKKFYVAPVSGALHKVRVRDLVDPEISVLGVNLVVTVSTANDNTAVVRLTKCVCTADEVMTVQTMEDYSVNHPDCCLCVSGENSGFVPLTAQFASIPENVREAIRCELSVSPAHVRYDELSAVAIFHFRHTQTLQQLCERLRDVDAQLGEIVFGGCTALDGCTAIWKWAVDMLMEITSKPDDNDTICIVQTTHSNSPCYVKIEYTVHDPVKTQRAASSLEHYAQEDTDGSGGEEEAAAALGTFGGGDESSGDESVAQY